MGRTNCTNRHLCFDRRAIVPTALFSRAGHASLVDTQDGQMPYMAYLCGRPLPNRGRCVLGRETAIQKMVWSDDGWLRTDNGEGLPQISAAAPDLPAHPFPATPARDNFDSPALPIDFQWLRTPCPQRIWSLTQRPGWLRLFGRETIGSQFEQTLVARRQQDFCFTASTRMEFQPEHFQQAAGLVLYYNATKFHYLHLTEDETIGRHLRVMSCAPDVGDSFSPPIPLPPGTADVELRMDVDFERLIFSYRLRGQTWQRSRRCSTRASYLTKPDRPRCRISRARLRASVVRTALRNRARGADFDYFEYSRRAYQPRIASQ